MAATKRLTKELCDLEKELQKPDSALYKIVRNIVRDESNIFQWTVVILPTKKPYDRWGFSVNLAFSPEYPFKPPKVSFPKPIYHPNVDENGNVCLPVVSPDSWKPATKVLQSKFLLFWYFHEGVFHRNLWKKRDCRIKITTVLLVFKSNDPT